MNDCTCEGEFIWACGPECDCFHHEQYEIPEEDDYYSYDGGTTWYQYGKQIFKCSGRCEEPHNIGAHLAAYAIREKFWPNAWIISDHGNPHLHVYME